MLKHEILKSVTFLYFAYDDNMLTFRMHMHTPSAEFVSIARLDNYRVQFIRYCSFWGGPTATLVPTANAHTWGTIWKLNVEDVQRLDTQREVQVNKYYIKHVAVLTPYLGNFIVRVNIQKISPLPRGDNDPIPVEDWPSWTLKEIMIMGATEHKIPRYYINQLERIKDNGQEGALRTVCLLRRYAKDEPCECRVPGRIPRQPLKLDLKLIRTGRRILEATRNETEPHKIEYQLNFLLYSERWRGAVATIVPAAGSHMWGALWKLHRDDLPALDTQEGVHTNRYYAKTVDVITSESCRVPCRVYQQTEDPPALNPGQHLPEERRPSITYLQCIIRGAKECHLPQYYVEYLEKIPHNGQEATSEMVQLINEII